jgi:hypothetical protein
MDRSEKTSVWPEEQAVDARMGEERGAARLAHVVAHLSALSRRVPILAGDSLWNSSPDFGVRISGLGLGAPSAEHLPALSRRVPILVGDSAMPSTRAALVKSSACQERALHARWALRLLLRASV